MTPISSPPGLPIPRHSILRGGEWIQHAANRKLSWRISRRPLRRLPDGARHLAEETVDKQHRAIIHVGNEINLCASCTCWLSPAIHGDVCQELMWMDEDRLEAADDYSADQCVLLSLVTSLVLTCGLQEYHPRWCLWLTSRSSTQHTVVWQSEERPHLSLPVSLCAVCVRALSCRITSTYVKIKMKLPFYIIVKSNRSTTQQAAAQDSNDKPNAHDTLAGNSRE